MSILEFKYADDPALQLMLPPDFSAVVVEATTVAHKRAASLSRHNLAEGCYAILSGHELKVNRDSN